VDSLQPSTNYTFQASFNENIYSEKVTARTMDTTSHEFTWQTFEFGEHSSSVLYDVAIIDENNIWAVGEIYLEDTSGSSGLHNAIHWDGNKWEIIKISVEYNGNQTIARLEGIFVLPSGEIILSSGLPYLPQGNNWRLYHLWDMGILDQDDGGVNRIWGTSMNDLYFVGRKGTIVHYNGSGWTKIESPIGTGGTGVDLNNICGTAESNKIWISGYALNSAEGVLLELENNSVTPIWKREASGMSIPPYGDRIYGIWCSENNLYVVSNDGVFRKKTKLDLPVERIGPDFPRQKYKLTGSGDNDLYAVGSRSVIWHYNGKSWAKVNENTENTSVLYSADTKNGITVSVGTEIIDAVYHRGVIIISK
jgi:hypothetical protein